jgi:hypothetical protein
MARYRIWCRSTEVAPNQHLVTACAIPASEEEAIGALTSESRLVDSAEIASVECATLVAEIRKRIVEQGHEVTTVDFV